MKKIILNRQLLGADDLVFGLGTVQQQRRTQAGLVEVIVNQINASHIPYDATDTVAQKLTTTVADLSTLTTTVNGLGTQVTTILGWTASDIPYNASNVGAELDSLNTVVEW